MEYYSPQPSNCYHTSWYLFIARLNMSINPPEQKATVLGKIISWFCIIFGVSAIATPAIYAAFGAQSGKFQSIYYLILGVISVALGYFGLKHKPSAFFFIALIFLPQIIAFSTPDLSYNFIGPIQIGYGFGNVPHFHFYINLLAIIICSLSAINVFKLTSHTNQ
ncbi:hypothetical protein D9M69_402300 [compost metagenome]